jgi:hypothetical protein
MLAVVVELLIMLLTLVVLVVLVEVELVVYVQIMEHLQPQIQVVVVGREALLAQQAAQVAAV